MSLSSKVLQNLEVKKEWEASQKAEKAHYIVKSEENLKEVSVTKVKGR